MYILYKKSSKHCVSLLSLTAQCFCGNSWTTAHDVQLQVLFTGICIKKKSLISRIRNILLLDRLLENSFSFLVLAISKITSWVHTDELATNKMWQYPERELVFMILFPHIFFTFCAMDRNDMLLYTIHIGR